MVAADAGAMQIQLGKGRGLRACSAYRRSGFAPETGWQMFGKPDLWGAILNVPAGITS